MPKTLKSTNYYSLFMVRNEGIKRIKIDSKDKVKGFYTLLTNGSVRCLPNEEYIIPKYCLNVLNKNNVKFKIVE